MSILIKGMKMPRNCHECDAIGISDLAGLMCPCEISRDFYDFNARPKDCPLVNVPPHGDLIDKQVFYNKAAVLVASAMKKYNKLNEAENYGEWRAWNAILVERTAFKFDIADAPVVIEAEREKTDEA